MTSYLPTLRRRCLSLLVLPALLLTALAVPGTAQETTPAAAAPTATQAPSGPPVLEAAEVTVTYTPVDNSSRLADALASLHQRKYYVRSEDGTIMGPYASIDSFGGLVVLHDTATRVTMLTQALAQLTEAFAAKSEEQPDKTAEALVVREYVPRHQPVESLMQALDPLRRMVTNPPAQGNGSVTQVSNVSTLRELALLVLRDTEENVGVMLALLARLDVPAPQVLVTCTLLRAVAPGADPGPPANLPPELLASLKKLVSYQDFSQAGFAALRVAVVAGREMTLYGDYGEGRRFKLALQPAGYDPANGLLTLDRCLFDGGDGRAFETGVTLRAGEDTVLGAAGAEPLFVVLRITPL